MATPKGAHPPKDVDCVLLKKAVYGLKQAPREWNSTFVEFLFKLGFKRLYTDEGEETIIISVHVDDTNIMSASLPQVLWLINNLQKRYGSWMMDLQAISRN